MVAPSSNSFTGLRGGLMVCGTTSDAGKSTIVAALCRLLARNGVRVAPFKAQNMSLNSAVTIDGAEIGRAQALQAAAAGVEPEAAMNPVLLKPTGERASQVVVMGRPLATMSASDYHARKLELLPTVLDALASLRQRYDVVLCEGAGSPTEINLLDRDIVNLRVAADAGLPSIVVGDINPGGVYAALYGTVALLPERLRATVRGLVINKLRGDPALLGDGNAQLEALLGIPVLGVIPWLDGTALDSEDSLALDRPPRQPVAGTDDRASSVVPLDVAVIRLPRISNFTDVDPLLVEPGVAVRFVTSADELGDPDLIVLPGSKATISDLAWLRASGLADAIVGSGERTTVLGICAGLQMLGDSIADPDGVESAAGTVAGLGLLPVRTEFGAEKVTRRCRGAALGEPLTGYQIHHGRVTTEGTPLALLDSVDGSPRGAVADGAVDGRVLGTTVHGLFESDTLRTVLLAGVAARRGTRFAASGVQFERLRQQRLDELADVVAAALDLDALLTIIGSAG